MITSGNRNFMLALILVCSGCVDNAWFEAPQPENVKDEKSVPRKLRGEYISLSDSSHLMISPALIYRRKIIALKTPLSELDSTERVHIKNHTSADGDTTYQIARDSLFITVVNRDTLFQEKPGYALRKFKGYYFVSREMNINRWEVMKLARVRGGLVFGLITTKAELSELRAVTNQYADSVTHFRPTKDQFKKLVEQNGFRTEEKFVRIN